MKKYNITVNGKTYEVEVEEVGGAAAPASTPAPKAAPAAPAPKAEPASKPAPAPKAAPASGGESITAPMPGTVLDIKVAEGDSVSNGQVLLILEAMKMENEIVASADGTVASINVNKGASVNAGDVLVVIG